jgi:TonB-dependent SusC/RagA subfamily outer membrane receptor
MLPFIHSSLLALRRRHMVSLTPHAALSGVLLIGLISGCASGNGALPDPTAHVAPREPNAGTIVTAEDLDRTPVESIERALAAKVPGLYVSHTADGSIAIRIRGNSSIEGSNEPLYVIDGTPVNSGPGGSLTGINPKDIASIEVLKDAVSTSFYGVRGANGVIIIKTKRSSDQ